MKLSLNYLILRNFRSFKGEHKIRLKTAPGLYHVQGENEIDPSLGSNGSGKSSMLDIIPWTVYNRTSKGRRSHQIATWSEPENVLGELGLFKDGVPFKIQRGYKPTELNLNGESIEDGQLVKEIGLTFREFLSSIFFGQFSSMFFDLGAKEKLDFLSQLLGLDYWSDCSDKASEKKKSFTKEFLEVENEISNLRARIGEVERSKDSYSNQLKEARESKQDDVTQELVALLAELEEEDEKHSILSEQLGTDAKVLKEIGDRYKEQETIKVKAQTQFNGASNECSALSRQVEMLKSHLSTLSRGAKEGICPTCGQKIQSKTHLEGEKRKLEDELSSLRSKFEDAKKKETVADSSLKSAEGSLKKMQGSLDSAGTKVRKIEGEIKTLRATMAEKNKRLEGLKRQEKEREDRIQKLEEAFRKESLRLREFGYQQETEEKKLNDIEAKIGMAEFWVKGFHHLRMRLLEEALQRFQVEATNALSSLGLPDWEFKCIIERETKSGNLNRAIRFMVERLEREAYDLDDESGGEVQRVRLAGAIGLSAVILERRGINPGFEVWDEPTRHLSPEGIQDLLSFLSERAKSLGRGIYLIDHHSLDSGKAEGTLLVVKDSNGSRAGWV